MAYIATTYSMTTMQTYLMRQINITCLDLQNSLYNYGKLVSRFQGHFSDTRKWISTLLRALNSIWKIRYEYRTECENENGQDHILI